MSERIFSKVSPLVWRSPRFRGLGEPAQLAFFYFLSSPHSSSAGVYAVPDAYAASDLGWSLETYTAVRDELVSASMIDYDPATETVLVEKWFKHNQPANDDHATGARKRIMLIECERLREKALASFDEVNAIRIEREAAKAAEKQERANKTRQSVAELIGSTGSRLASTNYMRGRNGG